MALISCIAIGSALLGCPLHAASPDDLTAFVHYLGQSDGYGRDAEEFGYDAAAYQAANDATMLLLASAPGAPDQAALVASRVKGSDDWDVRVRALRANDGAMVGKAWDDHVAAARICDDVGKRLRNEGVID